MLSNGQATVVVSQKQGEKLGQNRALSHRSDPTRRYAPFFFLLLNVTVLLLAVSYRGQMDLLFPGEFLPFFEFQWIRFE